MRAFCGRFSAGSSLAFVSFALLQPLAARASKPDSVPDWVRSAAAQTLPAYSPGTNAVVLLDDTVYTVAPDGRATEHCRHVVKILRPQGRDEGMVFVPFDRDTKLAGLHIWSIGPDGHEYALKDNEVNERGFGEGNSFSDDRAKVASPPGRDPGGIIAFEYEQRARPFLTEKTWFFQENLPHLAESFTLELPPGYTYGTVWAHYHEQKAADLEHGRFRWEMKEVPGIDLERIPMRPSELSLAGRMTLHYTGLGAPGAQSDGSWKSIGEWYATLSRDRLASSPEIAAKAAELAGSHTDFYDKVEPIAEFVQGQIRYFVIEMGIGGYQPHFAADIFRNRYGDCKDKATLLSAMLASVGVHSALMMVDHRRGVVDPEAPSIVGDHMIAAIEIPKGYTSLKLRSVVTASSGRRYLIFDPTWEKTAFGQLEHNLQGGYGVLMEGSESEVLRLPVLAPELNTIRRSAAFQLQPDGSLKGVVTEKRFGDVSERRRDLYSSGNLKEQTEFLDHTLAQDFPVFSVADVKTENVTALNKELTTTYTLSADRFARSMGSLLMLRPRVLGTEDLRPDRNFRRIPIDLRETLKSTDSFDIELPAGYTVDEMPDPVKLDVGFAAYESSSKLENNVLHYTRTYTVREVSLPAERYPDVQRLAAVIAADEGSNAVLKKQ